MRDIRFDPARLFHEDGRRKELHELDEATRSAVRVEVYAEGRIKYCSPDKTAAREQAMKHLGLFKGNNQQKPAGVQVHVEGFRSVEFDPIPLTRKG